MKLMGYAKEKVTILIKSYVIMDIFHFNIE